MNGTDLGSEIEVAMAGLRRLLELDSELYRRRGFLQKKVGFGRSPALLNIDLANAWTRPNYPLSCDKMDVIIPGVQRLLAASRKKNIPIVYTIQGYKVIAGPNTDAGVVALKIPLETLQLGTELTEIDSRIAPEPDEQVIVKKSASGFHGTYLAPFLRAAGIDTVIVTGVTASACVKATVVDALSEGFRAIVVRECVGDRIPGAVEWNLFDMEAKFGDVESLETVLEYLENVNPREGATSIMSAVE